MLSVDVAAPVNVEDFYSAGGFDDGVDDTIVATAGRSQAGQLITKGFADLPGVLDERAVDEFDASRRDLLR